MTRVLVRPGSSIVTAFLITAPLICVATANAQGPSLEQQLLSEPVQDLAADAREKGDATRGAFLFHSPGLGCVKCHGTSPSETSFGPDLASWKKTVDDNHLAESVLQPSKKIDPQYQSLMVVTSDGRTLAGVQRARDQKSLTIQTGVGKTDIVSISLDDIEFEKQTEVSVMPAGQVNALRRRQEFLDLISYLIAIRDGGSEAADRLRPSAGPERPGWSGARPARIRPEWGTVPTRRQ